jgi:hypothetical protein
VEFEQIYAAMHFARARLWEKFGLFSPRDGVQPPTILHPAIRHSTNSIGPISEQRSLKLSKEPRDHRRAKALLALLMSTAFSSFIVAAQAGDNSSLTYTTLGEIPDSVGLFGSAQEAQLVHLISTPGNLSWSPIAKNQPLVAPNYGRTDGEGSDQPATNYTNSAERVFAEAQVVQDSDPVAQPISAPGSVIDTGPTPERSQAQPQIAQSSAGSTMDELDLALRQRQTFSDQPQRDQQLYFDLLTLQENILDMQRPVANAVTRYSVQSDHVGISQSELSQDIFLNEGASRIQPGLQYITYTPKTGVGVFEYSGGLDANYRINDWSALAGDVWVNSIKSGTIASNIIPTYDIFLTLWPNDYLRMDVDNKRETFDNITSLQEGITAETVSGSVDYTPSDDLRLTLRGGGSYYTDTNERGTTDAEAIWRITTLPTIEVGLRASHFSFSKQFNNGYFDPITYTSGEAMFQLQMDLTDQLSFQLAASGGIEYANPGGDKPLVKSSLQVTYKLVKDWALEGGIDYFSSMESNSSGFARTSANLSLHYKFD